MTNSSLISDWRRQARLAKAETIVEVQGKVSALLQQAIESANVETFSSEF